MQWSIGDWCRAAVKQTTCGNGSLRSSVIVGLFVCQETMEKVKCVVQTSHISVQHGMATHTHGTGTQTMSWLWSEIVPDRWSSLSCPTAIIKRSLCGVSLISRSRRGKRLLMFGMLNCGEVERLIDLVFPFRIFFYSFTKKVLWHGTNILSFHVNGNWYKLYEVFNPWFPPTNTF